MSKLTDLVKSGERKFLTRDCWQNESTFVVVLELDAANDVVTQHTWCAGALPYAVKENLTIEEALADDWEPATEIELKVFGLE